jgi:stage IV sporulation protein FB
MSIEIAGIRVHLFFFLTAFLLGWGAGGPWKTLIWVGIVLFSVLLHEGGHAVAGKAFGLTPKIELTGFGGLTRFSGGTLTMWQRVLVSLAGPFAGFVVGSVLVAVYVVLAPTLEAEGVLFALRQAMWVNIGWGVFNLLPVLPLDGGQVGLALLSRKDAEKGLIRMSAISVVFAAGVAALALLGLRGGGLFIGVLFGLLAFNSLRTLMAARSVNRDRSGGLHVQLEQAQQLLAVDPEQAMALAAQVRMEAQHAGSKAAATQIIAAVLLSRGDADTALSELQTIRPPYQPDPGLLAEAERRATLPGD